MHRIIWFPKAKNGLFFFFFFCQIAKLEYVFFNKIYYLKKKSSKTYDIMQIFVSGSDSKYFKKVK